MWGRNLHNILRAPAIGGHCFSKSLTFLPFAICSLASPAEKKALAKKYRSCWLTPCDPHMSRQWLPWPHLWRQVIPRGSAFSPPSVHDALRPITVAASGPQPEPGEALLQLLLFSYLFAAIVKTSCPDSACNLF